jgi:hypothetical protein
VAPLCWFVIPITAIWTVVGALAAATVQAPLRQRSVVLPGTDIVLEAGWRLLFTADAACAYLVPATWPIAPNHTWATMPDGRISATFDNQPSAGWAMHKMRLRETLKPATVLDDSDRRFWVELADSRRILHHISLTDGRTICSADVQVRRTPEPASEIVDKIISGVRVTRAGDLRWMKE